MSGLQGISFDTVFASADRRIQPPPKSPESPVKPRNRLDLEQFLKKTPLMILEEGAKGVYQQDPVWSSQEISMTTGAFEFEMTLKLRSITVSARANSKKSAKQKAAVAYLHELINAGKKSDFFIPGDTDEKSHEHIDQIAEKSDDSKRVISADETVSVKDMRKDIPTARDFPPDVPMDKNWVGALQEKAQKNKINAPEYSDDQLQNTKQFVVTCKMCNQQTRGIKSTKKAAKNLAAWLMLKTLEEGVDAIQAFDMGDEILEEIEAQENIAKVCEEAFKIENKKTALIELLSDKTRFADYSMEFKFPSVSTMGCHQIILEIHISRPITPDPDDLQMGAEHTQTEEIMKASAEKEREQKRRMPDTGPTVFPGHGNSEEAAIECACKSAIIHFNTYSF